MAARTRLAGKSISAVTARVLTGMAREMILNHMVKYKDPQLDAVFAALADSTRRGILESLSGGEAAVSELAAPHDMSLPGFMKHLRVLEDAGLVERTKEGRVVSCELSAAPMQAAAAWISRYEKFWTDKLDSLARYLYQQEELQTWKSSPRSPRSPSPAATRPPRKKSGGRGPTRKR
jgi:DNA-binding transcriptional ArsR family regulator